MKDYLKQIGDYIEEIVGNIKSVMDCDNKRDTISVLKENGFEIKNSNEEQRNYMRKNKAPFLRNGYIKEIHRCDDSSLFLMTIPYKFPEGHFMIKEGQGNKAVYKCYSSTGQHTEGIGNKGLAEILKKIAA